MSEYLNYLTNQIAVYHIGNLSMLCTLHVPANINIVLRYYI